MLTMNRRKTQLSVMAVAALAVFAVAAVMLLSGGNPAQADTASLAPDNGGSIELRPMQEEEEPTATPIPTRAPRVHATPEPCPGEEGNPNTGAANVVESGHIALFDVWWNPDEGELTNSSCPPTVAHSGGIDTRSPSNINIAKTVIHIPNSTKIDLSTSTTYTRPNYPELWAADDAENRDIDGNGTFDGVGDRQVWALPACPPDGTPATNGLCLSFSAALLDPADWTRDPEAAADAPATIEYHIDHVHQIDIDRQDPRYTLAYDAPPATGKNEALWNSHNARVAVMPVAPGGYERPTWFFTSRGTYELQVHIRGNPERDPEDLGGLDPLGKEPSVTSDVREYIIHVGAEADLGVGVTAVPESASPDDDVTITVTASNAGPETAPDTKVEVELPEGLTHSTDPTKAPNPSTGTYDSATGVWAIGELAVTNDSNSDTTDNSPTLTITATVAPGSRGTEQKVKATISATETVEITETVENGKKEVKRYKVLVIDPNPDNNMSMVTVVVVSIANKDPMFKVTRSVAEDSAAGTNVGDPIMVRDPDDTSHKFGLGGTDASNFRVDPTGQVTVAPGVNLDHECHPKYELTLTVSDSKDQHSNNDAAKDTAIDDVLGLDIMVSDVAPTVTLTADRTSLPTGQTVTLTATASDVPACGAHWTSYQWHEDGSLVGGVGPSDTISYNTAGTRSFFVRFGWERPNGTILQYTSNTVQVTWTDN